MKRQLSLAVVTSCFTRPLAAVLRELAREQISVIDLYCFQNQDFTQERANREQAIEQWYRQAVEEVRSGNAGGPSDFHLAAISTSLPDVSSLNERRRKAACKALGTLLQFAGRMSCRAIEVRAGRRIQSAVSRTDGKKSYSFSYSQDKALDQLMLSVSDVFSDPDVMRYEVGVALEIEPGPAYLLNDESAIHELWERLQRYRSQHWWPRVGLNLDIGHFLVNDWRPERLESILSRSPFPILHCHLSDHSLQHFADLPLGTHHRIYPRIYEWLEWFYNYVNSDRRSKFCTDTVSLELEATEQIRPIVQSYNAAVYLLKNIQGAVHPAQREIDAVILFADLRESTRITEALQAESLTALGEFTDDLFRRMTDRLPPQARVDKLIGDCIMVVFEGSDPQTLRAALRYSIDIQHAVKSWVLEFHSRVFDSVVSNQNDRPSVGVGLSYGRVLQGWFGAFGRGDYTVLGMDVIQASRLSSAKENRDAILVNDGLFEQALRTQAANPKHFSEPRRTKTGLPYRSYLPPKA